MRQFLANMLALVGAWAFGPSAEAQVERQKVEGSALQQGDNFGGSAAISGTWAVLGAAHADDVVSESGAAYVFEQTSTGWLERQRLKASDPAVNAGFGYAVQIEGTTIAIGAPGSTVQGMLNAGAVYVFENLNGIWTETQKLVPNDAAVNYGCGYSVVLKNNQVVAGAIGESHAGTHCGAAYIFEYAGTSWVQAAKLVASDASGGDLFGYSVAIDGDVAVVGAVDAWTGGFQYVGAAYVFEKQGSQWPLTETQKLVSPNPSGTQYFSYSVGILPGEIFVGALTNSIGTPYGGAVFRYRHSGASWVQTQVLLPSDLASGDAFGLALAVSGNHMVIGSASSLDLPQAEGADYVFTEIGSSWVETGKLIATDAGPGDAFGNAVAIDGTTILAGDAADDSACPSLPSCDSGSAYFFEITPDAAQYGSCNAGGPCSNIDGHGGCTNSTGQGAVLASRGSNSVAADDLVLEARWLPPGVHAIGFMGQAQTSVFLGDGRRVVAPGFGTGLYRLPVRTVDAGGVLNYGPGLVALSQGLPAGGHLAPGAQWNFQVWYRDIAGPCGSGTNTTNGMSVLFAP
jgi:hypothetical protein